MSGENELVFSQRRTTPLPEPPSDDALFALVSAPLDALKLLGGLREALGARALARALARLATRRRLLYVVLVDRAVVHHGWLTIGQSAHYSVGPDDIVIGPIVTQPAHRRRGFGAYGVARAVNAMLARGHRVFWINTSPANTASRALIARLGFEPAAEDAAA